MDAILLLLLALVWLIACWLRIVRQAQFFQIEEYDSRRYLRWALRNGEKRAPARPLGLWFIDLAGVLVLWLLLGSILPHLILITAAALSGWRQLRFQAKKPLVLTGRVKRLLGVSFICCAISLGMGALYLRSDAANLTPDVQLIFTHGLGLIALMLGPLWLVLGNLLLQPVEGFMRRRFLRSARAILERIDPKIIGITGSYGKTTTKHFLREILSLRSHVYATPKSYNTLMGISLAINRDLAGDFRSEYFISEMGAYAPGEIARICQLTPPDIAIVTEIGPQHLERFGSLDNIKRAKYEIIKNLPPDGVALFNWDNPYIRDMIAQGWPATILSVSRELDREAARAAGITWIAADIQESLAGLRFTVVHVATGESAAIKAAINGEHNVTNLLLCIAVAHYEGIPLRDISVRIRALRPAESRLVRQVSAAGITIINDAYSANPSGVASALKVLGLHRAGKRLLITPGMVELGALHERENGKLGTLAARHASDIILIGRRQTQPIQAAIQAADFDMERLRIVETLAEAVEWYRGNLVSGDAVLFLNDLPDTY